MKVYLGGTVNGSTWREYLIDRLNIDYFNPVVDDWNEEAAQKELYERRHSDFLLYVLTPRMTGFYSIAEVTDDSVKRPDRTLFCYLTEDGEEEFDEAAIESMENIIARLERNGTVCFRDLDSVVDFLNQAERQVETVETPGSDTLDCFISYGRKNSRGLAASMQEYLGKQGLHVWYDDGLVPMEMRHLDKVNRLIEKAHNFIFILSPHSIRSEYCLREVEYALRLGKRIIPVHHVPVPGGWGELPQEVQQQRMLQYSMDRNKQELFDEVLAICREEEEYVATHTYLTRKALHWDKKGKQEQDLLYGRNRADAKGWYKQKFENKRPPVQVSDTQQRYLERSFALSFEAQVMFLLNKVFSIITNRRFFDRFIGVISLANPLSLLPQLIHVIRLDDLSSISSVTFGIFAFLNASFALVGIKQKNLGMFISMFLSMLMNLAIVALKFLKQG